MIVRVVNQGGVYYTVQVLTQAGVIVNEADVVEVQTAQAFLAWLLAV